MLFAGEPHIWATPSTHWWSHVQDIGRPVSTMSVATAKYRKRHARATKWLVSKTKKHFPGPYNSTEHRTYEFRAQILATTKLRHFTIWAVRRVAHKSAYAEVCSR